MKPLRFRSLHRLQDVCAGCRSSAPLSCIEFLCQAYFLTTVPHGFVPHVVCPELAVARRCNLVVLGLVVGISPPCDTRLCRARAACCPPSHGSGGASDRDALRHAEPMGWGGDRRTLAPCRLTTLTAWLRPKGAGASEKLGARGDADKYSSGHAALPVREAMAEPADGSPSPWPGFRNKKQPTDAVYYAELKMLCVYSEAPGCARQHESIDQEVELGNSSHLPSSLFAWPEGVSGMQWHEVSFTKHGTHVPQQFVQAIKYFFRIGFISVQRVGSFAAMAAAWTTNGTPGGNQTGAECANGWATAGRCHFRSGSG